MKSEHQIQEINAHQVLREGAIQAIEAVIHRPHTETVEAYGKYYLKDRFDSITVCKDIFTIQKHLIIGLYNDLNIFKHYLNNNAPLAVELLNTVRKLNKMVDKYGINNLFLNKKNDLSLEKINEITLILLDTLRRTENVDYIVNDHEKHLLKNRFIKEILKTADYQSLINLKSTIEMDVLLNQRRNPKVDKLKSVFFKEKPVQSIVELVRLIEDKINHHPQYVALNG